MGRVLLSVFLGLLVAGLALPASADVPKSNVRLDVIVPPEGGDRMIVVFKVTRQADGSVEVEPVRSPRRSEVAFSTGTLRDLQPGETATQSGADRGGPTITTYRAPRSAFEAGRVDAALDPGQYAVVIIQTRADGTHHALSASDVFEIKPGGERVRIAIDPVKSQTTIVEGAPQERLVEPAKLKEALRGAGANVESLVAATPAPTYGNLGFELQLPAAAGSRPDVVVVQAGPQVAIGGTFNLGSLIDLPPGTTPVSPGTGTLPPLAVTAPTDPSQPFQIDFTLPPGQFMIVPVSQPGNEAIAASHWFVVEPDGSLTLTRLGATDPDGYGQSVAALTAGGYGVGAIADPTLAEQNWTALQEPEAKPLVLRQRPALGFAPGFNAGLTAVDVGLTDRRVADESRHASPIVFGVGPRADLIIGQGTNVIITQQLIGGGGETVRVDGSGDASLFLGLDATISVDLTAIGVPPLGKFVPIVGVDAFAGAFGIGGETTDRRRLDLVNPIVPDTTVTVGGESFGWGAFGKFGFKFETDSPRPQDRVFFAFDYFDAKIGVVQRNTPVNIVFEQPGGSTRFDLTNDAIIPVIGLSGGGTIDLFGLPAQLSGDFNWLIGGGSQSFEETDQFGNNVVVDLENDDAFGFGFRVVIPLGPN